MPAVSESQREASVADRAVGYQSPNGHSCRILLIEDQPVFRDAFETLLRSSVNPTELVGVDCLAQMTELLAKDTRQFDCVFLDLLLPDAADAQALLAVQECFPDVPIVVMTGYASDSLRRRCLGLGAFDLLNKNWDHATLADRIRQIFDAIYADLQSEGAKKLGPVVLSTLSPRQIDVMQLLLKGKSNKEISRQLEIAEGTVKTHVTGLLRALRVSSRSEAIAQFGQLRI